MRYNFLAAFFFFTSHLFAQGKEDKLLFQKFITVCNAYKQLPLQLIIEYKKTSNIPAFKDDSTAIQGEFYIQKSGAYIRFGNAEQIVTDSFALMVIGGNNQMVLSAYKTNVAEQITNMINMPVKDSSIKSLMERYTIQQKLIDNETAILEIINKQNLYSTELPLEKNILTYNLKNANPIKIETTKRSLIKKPTEATMQLSVKTVSIPGKGEYLIKEDVTEYVYKSISHDSSKKLPVQLADRIEKNSSNNYTPVQAYKNYALIVH